MKATISSIHSHSTPSRTQRPYTQPTSAPDVLEPAPPQTEVSASHVKPLRRFLGSSHGSLLDYIGIGQICAYVKWTVPVGCPWKGTTISSKGPADACATGITPAAFGNNVKSARNASELHELTYHKLDNINTKMLVYHRTYPNARSGQPVEHQRVRSVDHKFYILLQWVVIQFWGKSSLAV
jgi:hypothetical protein